MSEDESKKPLLAQAERRDLRIKPKRTIIVEPLLFVYFLSGIPVMDIREQYMYNRIAEDMGIDLNNLTGVNATEGCDTDKSNPGYIKRESVQTAATNLNTYITVAEFLPAILLVLVFGAYSDRMGRRSLFILPCVGSICQTLLYMAIIHFHLPVDLFILSGIEYLFGGGGTALLGNSFAYLADCVPKEKRPLRMVFLDAIIFLNGAVGHLIVGYLIRWQGYFKPLYFVIVGKFLSLLYAVFFIPETVPKKKDRSQEGCCKAMFSDLKNGAKLFTKDDGSNRRWQLVTLLLAYLMPQVLSSRSVMTLFEMNAPLCWGSVYIGYYGVVRDVVPCIFLVLSALLFKRFISIEGQAVMGLTSEFAHNLYFAFVTSSLMMYLVPVIGCISFLYVPMIRAKMSGLIRLDEQGTLFAVLSSSHTLSNVFSTVLSNKIYASTLFLMEGFLFLCVAVFNFIGLAFMIYYCIRIRRKTCSDEEKEAGKETIQ